MESLGNYKGKWTTKVTHRWTIHKSSLVWEELDSREFTAVADGNSLSGYLRVYPDGKTCRGWVSLFLATTGPRDGSSHRLKASLLTPHGDKVNNREVSWGLTPTREYGFSKFIRLDRLMDDSLLPGDTFTLICELTVTGKFVNVSFPQSNPCFQIPPCRLVDDLDALLDAGEYGDVLLHADGRDLRVYRGILAARSPVFAAMFANRMKESKRGRVDITDVSYEVLREVVRYAYTGRAPEADKMSGELLAAADKYDMERLRIMCEKALWSGLSVDTAASVLALADRHSSGELKKRTVDFMRAHAADN